MFESEGPTLFPLQVAYFIVFLVISWLGYAGGPAVQIDSHYKHGKHLATAVRNGTFA
ncbi:hypothetical protein QFZ39_006406 [Paraburkholderia graminis]|nr:hypothetical protein [Paraburkholderia graminis]